MKESTIMRNHSVAPSVITNALTQVLCRDMKESTLMKDLSDNNNNNIFASWYATIQCNLNHSNSNVIYNINVILILM